MKAKLFTILWVPSVAILMGISIGYLVSEPTPFRAGSTATTTGMFLWSLVQYHVAMNLSPKD